MAPMTAQELPQHPEYPHIVWQLTPQSQGKVPVAKDRGGPFNVAYELHGSGPRHLVVSGPTSRYYSLPFGMGATSGMQLSSPLSCHRFVSVAFVVSTSARRLRSLNMPTSLFSILLSDTASEDLTSCSGSWAWVA